MKFRLLVNMETANCDTRIKTYIENALNNDSFKCFHIMLTDSTDKSEGYASDINFARVLITTVEGVEMRFEIVVKSSKMKSIEDPKSLFKREIYFYETILPKFTKFQVQSNIKDVFTSLPKFYKAIFDESTHVIVLDNLKESGYALYDRKKPLDLHHTKLVLQEYGKFHAISFALRNKSRNDFETLVSDFDDVLLPVIVDFLSSIFQKRLEVICDTLRKTNKLDLYETCHKILECNAGAAMIELLETVEPESAILHGDCWNNNFMFKYESGDDRFPSKVAILDWQLSRLHSPILDISCFIYSCCSEDQLNHFDELLDTYYFSFSTFLAELGCDSDTLFPYSTLKRHWKKYSLYGFLMSTSFLNEIMCENENASDFYENENDFTERIMNLYVKDEHEYQKRLVAIVAHYCKYIS